jgi:hypothetical protein
MDLPLSTCTTTHPPLIGGCPQTERTKESKEKGISTFKHNQPDNWSQKHQTARTQKNQCPLQLITINIKSNVKRRVFAISKQS